MPASKGIGYYNHGPHLHEYLEEFNRDVFSKYDCMTLAEAPMVTPKVALKYIDETNAPVLDMMIQFASQEADCLFMDFNHIPFSLRKLKRAYSSWQNGLAGKVWQYFITIPDIKSVGVKDESRYEGWPAIIRAVNTKDAMTATIEEIPYAILHKIVNRITAEVEGINRVLYDLTPKGPGTIEWE